VELGIILIKKICNFILREENFENFKDFHKQWATNHPNKNAKSINFTIMYGDSYVDEKMLVAVDGYRAMLPLPKSVKEPIVKKEDVNFAKFVDNGGRVAEYLKRSGISIEED
jgi:hypothetical protein